MQVIIKQEPGEVSTQQQQQMVSTVTSQQQPAASAAHQFVAMKGGHMISMSAQKQAGGSAGGTTGKVSFLCIQSNNMLIYMLIMNIEWMCVVKIYRDSKTKLSTSHF